MTLASVSIGIKTFLRDYKLFTCIDDIRRTMPEAQMIIADDGDHTEEKEGLYAELIREGHKVILCPYDSGFGYKSNEIARVLDRSYLLVASDDFDFRSPSVAVGIEKMLAVLEDTYLCVASGRVNEREYEFYLKDDGFGGIEELPCGFINAYNNGVLTHPYYRCDLTVNYSLIRKSVFNVVRWDNEVKIGGGEHGAFFLDLNARQIPVAWVPGVNINTQSGQDSERYQGYRARANSPERPCFVKRGIKKYVLGNGQVDYEE